MKTPRLSPQTRLLLERFLDRPSAWRYGYELSRETGLKSGTLYPLLMRLTEHGLLETKWVTVEEGVPPRHTYRLTPKGLELARTVVVESRSRRRVRQTALEGGRHDVASVFAARCGLAASLGVEDYTAVGIDVGPGDAR